MKKNRIAAVASVALLASVVAGCGTLDSLQGAEPPMPPTVADYARAASFMPFNLVDKVKNPKLTPHWIDQGEAFWYRRDTDDGYEFVLVNAATGAKYSAFNHIELARMLEEAADLTLNPNKLPISSFTFGDSRHVIEVTVATDSYRCDFKQGDCVKQDKGSEDNPAYLYSPDGSKAAFVRSHNIWIKDLTSGKDIAVTTDGTDQYSYGKLSDRNHFAIPMRRTGKVLPPAGSFWSPNGKYLTITRLDERGVEPYPFLDSAPANGSGRPQVFMLRSALPGEKHQLTFERYLVNVDTGNKVSLNLPDDVDSDNREMTMRDWAWSADNQYLYFYGSNGRNTAWMYRVNARTGEQKQLLLESNDSFFFFNNSLYSKPNTMLLPDSNEFIWFSERSGWGHLYLYDLDSGRQKNMITSGDWLVRDVVKVDQKNRVIYFTGLGREAGRDPYYRHLYRVNFDGSELTRLTPENAFHEISHTDGSVSPNGRYFVDTFSTVDQTPVSVLRDRDGKLIAELERADASALYAMGWTAPEKAMVKAADGETDLVALVYKPSNFDPAKKYPVIEHLYGGPQMTITPRSFMGTVMSRLYVQAQRELGYIMVVTDVRGTSERSKTFNDLLFDNFGDYMIDDHVAVIEHLAKDRPYMDLNRVGVEGHSFGGYGSAHAILKRPDFYKVAVSSAGSQNYQAMYPIDPWFKPPMYSDGSHINPTGAEVPENWKSADNGSWAANLQGKLMLVYGELDENAYPAATLQLARSLEQANKSYDLLYLPNEGHDFARTNMYFIRNKWDYFVEHLKGEQPPKDFLLSAPPAAQWRGKLQ